MFRFHWSEDFQKTGMRNMRDALANGTQYGDCIGQARCGDICFDLVIRDYRDCVEGEDEVYLGMDLYVGGIDSGYGYSAEDAMLTGKYATKHDVPDDELYPYDEHDGCGGPLKDYAGLSFEDFIAAAELEMNEYLLSCGDEVLAAARRPFHYW